MDRVEQFAGVIAKMDDFFVSTVAAEDETVLVTELVKRISCISMDSASECTMREFISPVLIGALNVIQNQEIIFRAEYKIEGWSGNGPVDYDVMYKLFHVCVAEAKKEAIEAGIAQNCGQLMASRDIYDHSVVATRKKRKRSFDPNEVKLRKTIFYGFIIIFISFMFSFNMVTTTLPTMYNYCVPGL